MQDIEHLLNIMKSLRDPVSGCPWDREQTIASIKSYTLEETYEVIDAIERHALDDLKDELGDLLFHIVFYSEIADEEGAFNFSDVVTNLTNKLTRRHPHVFSDAKLESSEAVKLQWRKTKHQERNAVKGEHEHYLDDISAFLPAMTRAKKLQKRAAGVGFDWSEPGAIIEKLEEELQELKESITEQHQVEHVMEELGDVMFCCINLARQLNMDPEFTLRKTNEKFIRRFHFIEDELKKQQLTLEQASLEQMEQLWNQAKDVD